MANATTLSKGTRIGYHLTENTTHAAIAAGAAMGTGWVQVLNVQDVDVVINVIEDYDDGDLEDATEVMAQDVKPGKITFSKKKNYDTTSQSVTLMGMADGSSINSWAVFYADGTIVQTGYGRLKCTSGGKASNGDLKAKAMETYEIVSKTNLTVTEHA